MEYNERRNMRYFGYAILSQIFMKKIKIISIALQGFLMKPERLLIGDEFSHSKPDFTGKLYPFLGDKLHFSGHITGFVKFHKAKSLTDTDLFIMTQFPYFFPA